jgi:hypothetical protein
MTPQERFLHYTAVRDHVESGRCPHDRKELEIKHEQRLDEECDEKIQQCILN